MTDRHTQGTGRAPALALWLIVLMILAPILGAVGRAPVQLAPALFAILLSVLGLLAAAAVGRCVVPASRGSRQDRQEGTQDAPRWRSVEQSISRAEVA